MDACEFMHEKIQGYSRTNELCEALAAGASTTAAREVRLPGQPRLAKQTLLRSKAVSSWRGQQTTSAGSTPLPLMAVRDRGACARCDAPIA